MAQCQLTCIISFVVSFSVRFFFSRSPQTQKAHAPGVGRVKFLTRSRGIWFHGFHGEPESIFRFPRNAGR